MQITCDEKNNCIVVEHDGEYQRLYIEDYLYTAYGEVRDSKTFGEALYNLRRLCAELPGACLCGSIKQGSNYTFLDKKTLSKGDDFTRDRWGDGMSWEQWISENQIAKEFYARARRRK